MATHPAAPLLAADLGHLPHTNKAGQRGIIQLPGFMSNAGMSDEQAQQVGTLALAIAEAIIEDLTQHGYPPTHETTITSRIQNVINQRENPADITLHCNRCHRPVIEASTNTPTPHIHVANTINGLTKHTENCQ
jgi:hypothetical protein